MSELRTFVARMNMHSEHVKWMQRCIRLALNGAGPVSPNPMVGAVLVRNGKLLAEGWHKVFGGAHAEVECLNAFGNEAIPEDAILYVNLEPCSHHGKTPPCADLIIARGVKQVVIGQRDPFPEVSGSGIARLKQAGVLVTEGVLENECRWLQRRFNTVHTRQRPYVVLKWAVSADGFLDGRPRSVREVQRITGPAADTLVHRWRSEEQAILVGSRTVLNDDPQLTVRLVHGRSPLRVVLDRAGRTPADSRVYDATVPTLLFTAEPRPDLDVEQSVLPEGAEPLPLILAELARRKIVSVLVEGGSELLGHFLRNALWDEARVLHGTNRFGSGTPAPNIALPHERELLIGPDRLELFLAPRTDLPVPSMTWHW